MANSTADERASNAPGSSGAAPSGDLEGDAKSGANVPGAPAATGVVVVHSASFPSFRLCFSNLLDQVPQPDSNVMPEANVVGVEIGSLVRIDPLQAPGTVYVIAESEVRSTPDNPNAVKCRELLATGTQKTPRSLTKDNDYHIATAIDEPLGQNNVSVLAITGCGSQAFLNDLGAANTSCGASWNVTSGNLTAQIVKLATTPDGATAQHLPVQLFHMSPALEAFKGAGGTLDVSFGELAAAGKLEQPVTAGAIFKGGQQTTLTLDQSEPSVYGAYGFRVTATSGAGSFTTDQSLAGVQELSSPRELPTSYYGTASNYALMLLGDPAHKPTLQNGDPNPSYNPRQAVHILAVPVLDPTKADAGAGGDASTGDGGT